MDIPQLNQNPFLTGGLFLMVLGALLYYLKRLPAQVYDLVERFFILRLEIMDEDEAYQWMQVWLAERLRKTLSVSVVTRRSRPCAPDGDDEPGPYRTVQPDIHLVPGIGTYFFWYRRRFVTLHRDRWESSGATVLPAGGDVQGPLRNRESFTLRIFSRNKELARQLIQECRDKALPDDGKLDLRVSNYNCWTLRARSRPRRLASVVLDGDQADDLLADMRAFLAGSDWYQATGVPYRRGYLLHGPPGNGKTSVVKALAGELRLNIYVLMLSDPSLNDSYLNGLLARVPERSILLVEDIDCAFTRRKQAKGLPSGLTFSGLLNALDGVASAEARIVIMTTNHLDRLDPALIRPGRVDVKLWFGNATADQARRLYQRFFPDRPDLAGDFADRAGQRKHSMAALQDHLMVHRHSPVEAVERVGELDALEVSPQPRRQPMRRRLAAAGLGRCAPEGDRVGKGG